MTRIVVARSAHEIGNLNIKSHACPFHLHIQSIPSCEIHYSALHSSLFYLYSTTLHRRDTFNKPPRKGSLAASRWPLPALPHPCRTSAVDGPQQREPLYTTTTTMTPGNAMQTAGCTPGFGYTPAAAAGRKRSVWVLGRPHKRGIDSGTRHSRR
ncbi:hypothetical protein VTI28DRAFT_6748 [Corynascus sepedonium]